MGVVTPIDELVLFGSGIPPATNQRLQLAVASRSRDPNEAERLLREARAEDPGCLPAHYALYKFYANQRRLAEAEAAVRVALVEAARQGGFPRDWRQLAGASEPYPLHPNESGRFYLFSLKALAFVTLRQNRPDEAIALLGALQRLDPEDRVGGSVVRKLAEALSADGEDGA